MVKGNPAQWLETLRKCEALPYNDLFELCYMMKELLLEEGTVQAVSSPVTICGDIHGQFYDLLELFKVGGEVPDTNYLFLGDYVDRGYHSVETFSLLMVLKAMHPDKVTLLRGNHESRQITQFYGFYDECLQRYNQDGANAWREFMSVFDYLPLSALVDGEIFCVHAGLSPSLETIQQIQILDRVQEIPHEGPFCDLMWSDPEEVEGWSCSARGAGWLFGESVVNRWCHVNGIELIARAHQLSQEGYKFMFTDRNLVTVWSAPNYCYRCNNLASVMEVDSRLDRTFKLFAESPESQMRMPASRPAQYFL